MELAQGVEGYRLTESRVNDDVDLSSSSFEALRSGRFITHGHRIPASRVVRTAIVRAHLRDDWTRFLERLDTPEVGLSPSHAAHVRQTWKELRAAIGPTLSPPRAEPGEEGEFRLSWSRSGYYAEVEIYPNGMYEWFLRDRVLDKHDGTTEARWTLSREFIKALTALISG